MTDKQHADFIRVFEPVVRFLFGEPNAKLSTKTNLRYGTHGSLSINLITGTWHDHETDEGGGLLALLKREVGTEGRDSFEWLDRNNFKVDTNGKGNGADHHGSSNGLGKIHKVFAYPDEVGVPLFEVVKFIPKNYRQRKPDGSWSVKGVRQVPYRLPELIEAIALGHVVFIVEGEKDVDNMIAAGMPATCNAGGAGNWRDALNHFFKDADVVIIPDNDPQKKHPKTGALMFHDDGRPILPGQDHAQDVARHLSVVARRVRVLDLTKHWQQMPLKGDVSDWLKAGGNAEKLYALVDTLDDWVPTVIEAPPIHPNRATVYPWPDAATLIGRAWMYAMHYVRGFVCSTVAPGGTGKTTLHLFEAIMMAAMGLRVWYISGEDPRVEIDRRIAAHVQHHKLDISKMAGNLFVDDKQTFPLRFTLPPTGGRNAGVVFDMTWIDALAHAIEADRIDVVIIDPLVGFLGANENDNATMDAMVKLLAETICIPQNCCIELSHHVRKPSMAQMEITVDDARGGGALVNACRSCRVINRMSSELAERAGVDKDKRTSYLRLDPGKRNMAPPEKATWWRLVSVLIANQVDNVQSIEHWKFPSNDPDYTVEDLDYIIQFVREGGAARADSRSPQWLGIALAQRLNIETTLDGKGNTRVAIPKRDCPRLNSILSKWVKNGALVVREIVDLKERKSFKFYSLPNLPDTSDDTTGADPDTYSEDAE